MIDAHDGVVGVGGLNSTNIGLYSVGTKLLLHLVLGPIVVCYVAFIRTSLCKGEKVIERFSLL
jgi:hypothetical protein